MVTELHAVKPAPGVEKVLAPNDPQNALQRKMPTGRYSGSGRNIPLSGRELITIFIITIEKRCIYRFCYINQEQDMKALRPLTASLMLLTSCLLISNTTLAKTTLKLSHNQDKSHAVHKALSYLADKTKEYSNGELVIRIYPNATLGNERESLELMNSGALQMVKVNAASLESFAPDYSLFSLPFLFRDRDHYYRVLQSDLGKKYLIHQKAKVLLVLRTMTAVREVFIPINRLQNLKI